jgi:hypothetical protein
VENFTLVVIACCLCFYAGLRAGRYSIDVACEKVLDVLAEEKIIRMVTVNGHARIYSGNVKPDLPDLPDKIDEVTKNKQ